MYYPLSGTSSKLVHTETQFNGAVSEFGSIIPQVLFPASPLNNTDGPQLWNSCSSSKHTKPQLATDLPQCHTCQRRRDYLDKRERSFPASDQLTSLPKSLEVRTPLELSGFFINVKLIVRDPSILEPSDAVKLRGLKRSVVCGAVFFDF